MTCTKCGSLVSETDRGLICTWCNTPRITEPSKTPRTDAFDRAQFDKAEVLAHARTLEIELGEAMENLKTEKQYAGHKNDTANTFMLQVKKLQAENTSLHAQISNACVSLQRGDNIEIAAKAAQEHILKLQETINQF